MQVLTLHLTYLLFPTEYILWLMALFMSIKYARTTLILSIVLGRGAVALQTKHYYICQLLSTDLITCDRRKLVFILTIRSFQIQDFDYSFFYNKDTCVRQDFRLYQPITINFIKNKKYLNNSYAFFSKFRTLTTVSSQQGYVCVSGPTFVPTNVNQFYKK